LTLDNHGGEGDVKKKTLVKGRGTKKASKHRNQKGKKNSTHRGTPCKKLE